MVVNAEAGFKIEFLYSLPSLCCLFLSVFPPSPSVSFSCSLSFFPDDSHPSMKSISHLGTGWHWHAGRAIWRLMAKLYYAIAPEWQSAVSSQLPYLSDVFMNSVTGACFNIWFRSLLGEFSSDNQRVCNQVIDLDQWYCVLLGPFISTANPWHKILVISPFFPSFSFFSFLLKRADFAPLNRSRWNSLKQPDTLRVTLRAYTIT